MTKLRKNSRRKSARPSRGKLLDVPNFGGLEQAFLEMTKLQFIPTRGQSAKQRKIAFFVGASVVAAAWRESLRLKTDRTMMRVVLMSISNECNQYLFPGSKPMKISQRTLNRSRPLNLPLEPIH